MVRIGADRRILAGDRIVGEPAGDPRELRLAIAIVAAQPRVDMVAAIRLVEPRREHVVHAQPPRDRVDIEVEEAVARSSRYPAARSAAIWSSAAGCRPRATTRSA